MTRKWHAHSATGGRKKGCDGLRAVRVPFRIFCTSAPVIPANFTSERKEKKPLIEIDVFCVPVLPIYSEAPMKKKKRERSYPEALFFLIGVFQSTEAIKRNRKRAHSLSRKHEPVRFFSFRFSFL